ncbi:MAG TPA: acetylxylan esterase [Bryobacterales bacterium]|nr:acetylxylan esterase [Bryobacterales bacterium]
MKLSYIAAVLFCFLVSPLQAQSPHSGAERLDFLTGLSDFHDLRNMLPEYLDRIAMAQLDERARTIAQISTPQDVAARRAYLRERMLRALGGLPQRTPLNAQVTGVLERDGYRIEKIIFESQPHFYVTANLYVPTTGHPPYPALLFPLGHEEGAKAHFAWQYVLVSLARRGYVALAWDTLGQGERIQLYDADLEDSRVVRSTTEHSIQGIQCLLAGDNIARYTIWDGMRALDYLLSRPEVDRTRIGCTGNSGGGTHTAYLSALDDRITVAAPSCYITSWRWLLRTIGPQDAEQCIPPWIADGLDHADFIYAFAPKPYLILSAIRDFFSITGARETYAEARRIYAALDASDKLSMFEADDGHGYNPLRRLAGYGWFDRWLKNMPDAKEVEAPVAIESEQTLWCTKTGQVATSLGGETVSSLNRKRVEQSKPGRVPLADVPERARQLTGFQPRQGPPKITRYGVIARDGYRIDKLTYESEPGILVPALLYVPEGAAGARPAILYVNSRGKSAGAADLEEWAKAGFVALAIDARGWGETRFSTDELGSDFPRFFGDYKDAMTALLVGRTLVGMRAEDVSRGLDVLEAQQGVDRERIYGFGKGAGAIVLLHTAAFDRRLKKLALEEMLVSYESVVDHKIHRDVFESVIRGVLKSYDLPDLVAAVAPRPVSIVNAVDPVGRRETRNDARREYARAIEAFRSAGAAAALRFAERRSDQDARAVYAGLMSGN